MALTCHPVATVLGACPVAVNVPSELVTTDDKPAAPVPLNVIVFPPMPAPVPVAASLPDTMTLVPYGTEAIEFSVRLVGVITAIVACGALAVRPTESVTVNPSM